MLGQRTVQPELLSRSYRLMRFLQVMVNDTFLCTAVHTLLLSLCIFVSQQFLYFSLFLSLSFLRPMPLRRFLFIFLYPSFVLFMFIYLSTQNFPLSTTLPLRVRLLPDTVLAVLFRFSPFSLPFPLS
jgi:hypothetical protein